MLKNKLIIFFCETNKMIGNGHFVRTKNLYDKFQNRNYKVKLIINDIKKLFNYRNYLLVYDSPKSNYRDMNKLFNSGIQVICFDWFFSFKPYINISYMLTNLYYHHSKAM